MGGIAKTLAGRITLAVFALHLVMLPVLYLAVISVVRKSSEDQFTDYVRSHSRFVADSLEQVTGPDTEQQVADILDGFMLSGFGVSADVQLGEDHYYGTISGPEHTARYREDFAVGENGDDIYFTSIPISLGEESAILRLGYDEQPIMDTNSDTNRRAAAVLIIYWLIVLVSVGLIGRRVTSPIRKLQIASRSVASGQFAEPLTIKSDLVEFVELSNDLENMRSELTSINAQLEREIKDRQKSEEMRAHLELLLRHKQRLETIGTLAGGISHELNNLLLPIILYSEMVIEDLADNTPVRSDVERILETATRARQIVSQVLMFSRQIDQSQLQPVDLIESVDESIELIRPAMPPNIVISRNYAIDSAEIFADKSALGQVMVNLITNAYQSMGSDGGELRIELTERTFEKSLDTFQTSLEAGDYYAISLADDGAGMTDEVIQRIFEPFFSTREIGEGTGLGLAVVHGIVSALGGGITVTSKLGTGSRFDVYFPLDADKARRG